jgi:polynucleotide 5'-hydroxyl-kinase GRC3/NOL9
MLSAVAARKAALAAQSGQTLEPLVPSGSATSSPKPPSLPKNGGSKRKPSLHKAHTTTKKSRKLKPFEKSNPRPVDAFKEQVDVIVVNSEGEESDSAMSVLDDSEQEPISQPSKKSLEKRAWSPSRPVDSSEDDSESGDVANSTPLDLSSLFPHLHRAQEEERDEGRVLSTFMAIIDENLFYLNAEELSSLGLSGVGCLVALNTKETLCLLGTCTLTVLHGSVAVFGTTLSASFTAYPIYAPRSSPLPIIEPSNKMKSVLPSGNLSPRLRDLLLSKTVIFIRELKTNVEGLGNICRTFDGVFQPSGWQRSSSTNPFKIPGLSLVIGSSPNLKYAEPLLF